MDSLFLNWTLPCSNKLHFWSGHDHWRLVFFSYIMFFLSSLTTALWSIPFFGARSPIVLAKLIVELSLDNIYTGLECKRTIFRSNTKLSLVHMSLEFDSNNTYPARFSFTLKQGQTLRIPISMTHKMPLSHLWPLCLRLKCTCTSAVNVVLPWWFQIFFVKQYRLSRYLTSKCLSSFQ